MGCYRETRAYLERIGSASNLSFDPTFSIEMAGPTGDRASLRPVGLPAPLHLLGALLRFRALSLRDRFSALRVFRAAKETRGLGDGSVTQWLTQLGQSSESRRRFWDLLTLATLNIAPDQAPAELLAVVLQRAFLGSRDASTTGLATVGLTQLHGEPAQEYISKRGGEVRVRTSVKEILFQPNAAYGVRLPDGQVVTAKSIVCALPPPEAREVVRGTPLEAHMLPTESLKPSAIVSLHVWPKEKPFSEPFIGFWDQEFHWAFRTEAFRSDAQKGPLTLVKSAAESFLGRGRQELQSLAEKELRVSIERSVLSVEREATWVPPIGNAKGRLGTLTPISNFFLAGDWTATGLPATIESAVCSGHGASDRARTFLLKEPTSLTPGEPLVTVAPTCPTQPQSRS